MCKEKFRWNKYLSNSIGFSVAVTTNFLLDFFWTFNAAHNNISLTLVLFISIAIVGLLLNNLFIYVFTDFGFNFYPAKCIAICLVFLWNFSANYLFNFHTRCNMEFPKKLWYLIFLATVGRLLVASILGLENDEAYYYTYAQHLQWNYFDHPPGVALLIRISTLNLYFHQVLFIRLGSIIFAAIGTILCYSIGYPIKNERTGWYAAILYNTSIYSSVIAGTFILPDSPQIVFWLGSLVHNYGNDRKYQDGVEKGGDKPFYYIEVKYFHFVPCI